MTLIRPPAKRCRPPGLNPGPPTVLIRAWPTTDPTGYPDLVREIPQGLLCIGRTVSGGDCLACNDGYMSGKHFQLSAPKGDVWLTDLGSTNGTSLNGRQVSEARLSAGDVVIAGSSVFILAQEQPRTERFFLDPKVVSCSPCMGTVLDDLKVAAVRDCAVLLLGETGTGKGFLARILHRLSPRSRGPFVSLNCATVPRGLSESELFGAARGAFTGAVNRTGLVQAAQDGTLFLDEIGELPMEVQAQLLTLLDGGEYRRLGEPTARSSNALLVAATNRATRSSLLANSLRPDLVARLSGETLVLPPLCHRCEDIVPLAFSALAEDGYAASCLTTEVVARLLLHPWP